MTPRFGAYALLDAGRTETDAFLASFLQMDAGRGFRASWNGLRRKWELGAADGVYFPNEIATSCGRAAVPAGLRTASNLRPALRAFPDCEYDEGGVSMNGLGNLSQCIVYGDPAEVGRARSLRGRSLVASMAIESAVVICLLLWPLLTTAVLPQQHMAAPVPIFRPTPPPPPVVREQEHPAPRTPAIFAAPLFRQPARIPQHIVTDVVGEPPQIDARSSSITGDIGGSATIANVAPPEAKPRASTPIQVSGGVMAARLVHSVQPEYPAVAKGIHLEGTVQLRAIIGTDGTVQDIEIVNGNPILVRAAVAAVREWRYRPTLLSGKPVEVETVITVQFQMGQ